MEIKEIQFSGVVPATLATHGFFRFIAPPLETAWNNVSRATPGDVFNPCWGFCRNGVPIDLPAIDDHFGFALLDADSKTLIKGYYIEPVIPAYTYVPFYFKQDDFVMPKRDAHLILYVGYFTPSDTPILFHTDYKEFTISTGTSITKIFPWMLLGLLAIPFLIDKKV